MSASTAQAIHVGVKVVKTKPGFCTKSPMLRLLQDEKNWHLENSPYHRGENEWEVFFELDSEADPHPLSDVEIKIPGCRAARVLVATNDVTFTQTGDTIRFRMGPKHDTSVIAHWREAQSILSSYSNPRGGSVVIGNYHNWKIRASGVYARYPWPAVQDKAQKNWGFAFSEAVRLLEEGVRKQNGGELPYRGKWLILEFEVAAPRKHLDFPPHWNPIYFESPEPYQTYPFWTRNLTGHLYLDEQGRHTMQVGAGAHCLPEQPWVVTDSQGKTVLIITVRMDGGLDLTSSVGETLSLRPDKEKGAATHVWCYQGELPLFRAAAIDDPVQGKMRFRLEHYRQGQVVETWQDSYNYDPFTGNRLPSQPSSHGSSRK
jgi:hypothetical protein